MSFNCESEFIFIGKGDESFLENYSYELNEDSGLSGGKVFMSLEILNNPAEAEDIGEAIFANFKQKFYEDVEADPYQRFEEALKAANVTIETLKEEKVSRFIGNLNIAMGAIVEDSLYVSIAGDAEVYLVRKRFISIVSEGLAEESGKETFVNIANGTFEDGDSAIFSSSRLLRYITKGDFGKIFGDVKPGFIGQALKDLHDFIMTEILGKSAVIGVYMKEVNQEESALESQIFDASPSLLDKIISRVKSFVPSSGLKFPSLSSSWTQKIGEVLLPVLSKISGQKFEKPRMSKSKIIIIILAVAVLLVTGVFWLNMTSNQKRLLQEQQVKLNSSQDLINEAVTVGQFDKPKASELLSAAEQKIMEVLNSRFLRGEAVKMLDNIQVNRDALDDIKRIKELTVLADFSDKRSTVSALGLIAMKDHLYGFEYNALYEMILDKLQDPLTIDSVETVILGTDFVDRNSLLFLTRTGKMVEYNGSEFAFVNTKDGVWKKGVDMKSYNEKVYILDPERNQIWRYPRKRDGFDGGEAYNQNAQLAKGVSIAIDSSIYVLNLDGSIIQMYQGQKQDYPLRRPPLSEVTAATKVYTNADLNYLFVLEADKSRVLLYRKDPKNGGAQYQTQYVFEKTGALRDLVVADNRLYVTDDKKVYFVNLSGL